DMIVAGVDAVPRSVKKFPTRGRLHRAGCVNVAKLALPGFKNGRANIGNQMESVGLPDSRIKRSRGQAAKLNSVGVDFCVDGTNFNVVRNLRDAQRWKDEQVKQR